MRLRARGKGGLNAAVNFGDNVMPIKMKRRRSGTLGDMRGMLRGKAARLKPEAIEGWIDEARSKALPRTPKRRLKTK
jgi:hypothetical protein